MSFKTPADLAEMFAVDVRQILEWRRAKSWPSFQVGKTIRFTDEHVEQIVAMQSQRSKAAPVKGQTARSSRRRSA